MNDIKALVELDWSSFIIAFVTVIVGFLAAKKLLTDFCKSIGYTLPWLREREEMQKAMSAFNIEINQVKSDQAEIMDCLNYLKNSVNQLQERTNKAERARLKDRISQAYRYYKQKGEWTLMEKEAFEDMIESFKETGEHNTFVNEICAPFASTVKVVEFNELKED